MQAFHGRKRFSYISVLSGLRIVEGHHKESGEKKCIVVVRDVKGPSLRLYKGSDWVQRESG